MAARQELTPGLIGFTKLVIDDGVKTKTSTFGRTLIIGVPKGCSTVGNFKLHLTNKYIQPPVSFQFFLDEFCIPDFEDCRILTMFNEPIRVVFDARSVAWPCQNGSGATKPSARTKPKDNGFAILPIHLPDPEERSPKRVKFMDTNKPISILKGQTRTSNRTPTPSTSSVESYSPGIEMGFDQLDRSMTPITPITPILTPGTELRLTSSAKRRQRQQKALQNKLASELGFVENADGITHKNVKSPMITPNQSSAKFDKSMIATPNSDDVSPPEHDLTPILKGKKRRKTEGLSSSMPPLKIARESGGTPTASPPSVKKRPDTPRSIKNPSALGFLRNLEFKKPKPHHPSPGMQEALKRVVENLDAESSNVSMNHSAIIEEVTIDEQSENAGSDEEERMSNGDEDVFQFENSTASTIGLPETTTSGTPSYESMASLTGEDICENSVIAFRMTEMNEKYEPVISDFKEALVTKKSEDGILQLEYSEGPILSVIRSGKFEVEGYESEDTNCPTEIHISMLIDPKFVRKVSPAATPNTPGIQDILPPAGSLDSSSYLLE